MFRFPQIETPISDTTQQKIELKVISQCIPTFCILEHILVLIGSLWLL